MKVYIVDNGGQWTHREWRVLKYLDVETKIVPNTTPFEELKDLDGLILSGGSPNVASDKDAMTATVEEVPCPLLNKITQRILAEVKGVNRVLYDLSPQPCATIEWE